MTERKPDAGLMQSINAKELLRGAERLRNDLDSFWEYTSNLIQKAAGKRVSQDNGQW